MLPQIDALRPQIADLCRRFQVRRLELFGSAARATDFDPRRSDADFLIEFEPGSRPTITVLLDLQEALQQVLGRPVDVVERQVIEESPNYLRRRAILRDAEPVYVAG